ncbi:winged helix-turn-helix domain-containing protein [Sulfitobacter sp. OXR-159]|nr:winged helix-turn-helix domain-containing protein [Sulfitobacter sp. OXR-159]WPZ30729.1 winged helix-turn-helix domain-containing protein [Sulfitobacter sp. OXR-159]WPZ30830.1 winged helix-turn-helix domain-containing protein [Sulfitobacter sp. OXR-159]
MSARANEFLVWRAGTSVNWDCTQKDIAAEVGLSVGAVRAIMKRRGWSCNHVGQDQDPYAYAHLHTNARHHPTLRELGVEI